jgi:hypothetical protein
VTVAINNLHLDVDVVPDPGDPNRRSEHLSERELIERLRPLVRAILQEELDQLRRQHGR